MSEAFRTIPEASFEVGTTCSLIKLCAWLLRSSGALARTATYTVCCCENTSRSPSNKHVFGGIALDWITLQTGGDFECELIEVLARTVLLRPRGPPPRTVGQSRCSFVLRATGRRASVHARPARALSPALGRAWLRESGSPGRRIPTRRLAVRRRRLGIASAVCWKAELIPARSRRLRFQSGS